MPGSTLWVEVDLVVKAQPLLGVSNTFPRNPKHSADPLRTSILMTSIALVCKEDSPGPVSGCASDMGPLW